MRNHLRHFVFDVVGALLIILSPTLGWLPGPGGIPLFLAGLGLLSVHHEWARWLIRYVKVNGLKLSEHIFRDHPVWQATHDVLSAALIVGSVWLLNSYTRSLTLSLAIFLLLTGLTIFLSNRKRLARFTRWLQSRFNR